MVLYWTEMNRNVCVNSQRQNHWNQDDFSLACDCICSLNKSVKITNTHEKHTIQRWIRKIWTEIPMKSVRNERVTLRWVQSAHKQTAQWYALRCMRQSESSVWAHKYHIQQATASGSRLSAIHKTNKESREEKNNKHIAKWFGSVRISL